MKHIKHSLDAPSVEFKLDQRSGLVEVRLLEDGQTKKFYLTLDQVESGLQRLESETSTAEFEDLFTEITQHPS